MALSIAHLDGTGPGSDLAAGKPISMTRERCLAEPMASAMILAGWSLPRFCYCDVQGSRPTWSLDAGEIRFLKPVDGPFEARCPLP